MPARAAKRPAVGAVGGRSFPRQRRMVEVIDVDVEVIDADDPGGSAGEVVELTSSLSGEDDDVREEADSGAKPRRAQKNALHLLMQTQAVLAQAKCKYVPGLYQFENFVTEEEARGLVSQLERWHQPWPSTPHNIQVHWGPVTDYNESRLRVPDSSRGEQHQPGFLQPLVDRLCAARQPWSGLLSNWRPNEGNAIVYLKSKGHFIREHFDHRSLWGPVIVSVTLEGQSTLTFREYLQTTSQADIDAKVVRPARTVAVPLPPLCMQVLSGDARYRFTHELAAQDLADDKRIVVVFRMAV